ncbi:MAG TPA: hypothetical protein VK906_17240 [Egicoccus sp.]|nr:hypothetical protein [Egicoccus sp.]HSK24933.1 hypothetical protein [Egicoccus sp.]
MSEGPVPTLARDDPALERLHTALRRVDTLPVGDRVDTFEQVNDSIARELARLDEV